MGHSRFGYQTIRMDLGANGLNIAEASIRAPENSLVASTNCELGYRNVLRKRSKDIVLGNPILEPTPIDGSLDQVVSYMLGDSSDEWVRGAQTDQNTTINLNSRGGITLYGARPGTGYGMCKVARPILSGGRINTSSTHSGDFTVGFTMQVQHSISMGAIAGADGAGMHLAFSILEGVTLYVGISTSGLMVLIGDPATAPYSLLPGTAELVTDGQVHQIELRLNKTGSVVGVGCYADGVFTDSLVTLAAYSGATADNISEITVRTNASNDTDDRMAMRISAIYVRDTVAAPSERASILAVATRKKYREGANLPDRRMYVATEYNLWFDDEQSGMWKLQMPLANPRTNFADFRDELIVFNHGNGVDTEVSRIDRNYNVAVLDDAPNIRFGTTSINRLWGAGDRKFPLRAYFSGDRQPNLWFAPESDADGQETIDEVLGAGYFEIEGESGDEVRAMRGDFLGSVIIATNNKLFRTVGNALGEWAVQRLSNEAGAFGPRSMALVGNDLWIVGPAGIYTLRGIQEYGDMAAQRISAPIQGVFSQSGAFDGGIDPALAYDVRLEYDRNMDTVVLFIPRGEGNEADIYRYRVGLQEWVGPEQSELSSLDIGEAGFPAISTIITGNSDGEVSMRTLIGDPDVTCTVESQVLTGRSIDPRIVGMEKTWRNLRLIANPTCSGEFTIMAKVEDRPWVEFTKTLIRRPTPTIGPGEDVPFEVGVSTIGSSEELLVVEVPLGLRGKSMKFKVVTDAPEISWAAIEVEFSPDGYEKGE